MKKSDALQNGLFAIAALAMVAALVYLYNKTQAVDLREQNEIMGFLRELKEIDNRWDVEMLRLRLESVANKRQDSDRAAAANKALQSLTEAAQRTASPSLAAALPELAKAVREKADLFEKFRSANASTSAGLDGLLRNTAELRTQTAELKQRSVPLDTVTNGLPGIAQQYYWLVTETRQNALISTLNDLQTAAANLPDNLRVKAEQTHNAGELLLKHGPAEQALYNKLAYMSSGPRLDTLTFSFNRELEATLQDKERFRVYLIYYAGALLILLAYLGARLKAANESLELRVQERTRELSEALKHLKESEAQLIQSEKMSSLGQMVAGVAHEINTPLAYVKNSLGAVADKLPAIETVISDTEQLLALLQAGGSADPAQLSRQFALVSSKLGQIKQQKIVTELGGLVKDGLFGAGQMAEIVGNLKDFSRLDRSKVTSFNLNEGLNSTLLLAKHLLKGVTVKKQFGEIPPVICSPSQVNQVFLNLITNAVQAMEGGVGTISLATRKEGNGIAVDVADSGKGIAPDVLPKIFDPFFSTKEIGKGTGLGLSISFKIVEQHGGRISVESQPGKGTRFTVWLPAKPPAEAQIIA